MIQHNSQETESDWSTVTRRKVSRTKKFRAVKRRSSLSTIPETISEEEVNFSSEAEDERVEINLRPGYQSPSQWARGKSSYFRQFSGDDQPAPVSAQRQRQFEDDGRLKREGGCCSILIKLDNIRDKDQFVRRSSWRDPREPTHCPLCNNYLKTLPTFLQSFLARNTDQAQDSQEEEPPDSRVLQEEQRQKKLTEIEEKLKEARIMCDNIWERLDRAHTGLDKYINKIIQY